MDGNGRDDEAAERIAAWLRNKSADTRTWYEVRTLLQEFEIDRFTANAQDRISSALANVGIDIDPDLRTRDRRDTVVLSWTPSSSEGQAQARTQTVTPIRHAVTVRTAQPGGAIQVVEFDDVANQPDATVRWFDVHQPNDLDIGEAHAALAPMCAGLTSDMLADLFSPDPRPKNVRFGDGRIRLLSTFRVQAIESDEGATEDSHSKAGVLIFEPVEILVGPGWLMTCWHETQVFRAGRRIRESSPGQSADSDAALERAWSAPYATSADLAVLLLLELATTYKPACRQLRVWVEEWELDHYFHTDHAYEDTLVETQRNLAVLRDWLSPLNISGMRQDIGRAWFTGLSGDESSGGHERALRVDDRVDQSLAELHEVSKLVRDAFEVLEVRRVKNAQERDARFQRTIAIGGSAILIPTLVAGVMGANTWVPGEYGPNSARWAFLALIVVMLISAGAAWYALKRMHDRED